MTFRPSDFELQHRNSESRAKLAWALPSANGVDEVSKCDTSRQTPLSAKNQRIICYFVAKRGKKIDKTFDFTDFLLTFACRWSSKIRK